MVDAKSRGFYMILFAKANEVIEKKKSWSRRKNRYGRVKKPDKRVHKVL